MSRPPRVVVAAVQAPFLGGGAERHVERLVEELARAGCEATRVTMPLFEERHEDLVRSALLWRLGEFERLAGEPVDALIATRFPSYLARHPRKVAWVIHQYRQVYDQFGTSYSDFTSSPEDRRVMELVRRMDAVGLMEARRIFANSANVAERLRRFNGIESEPLYHPPPLAGRYASGPEGSHALWVGRFERWKRPGLALAALAHAPSARLVLVGSGPEEAALRSAAAALGVAARCEFAGTVPDDRLIEIYAGARFVVVTAAGEDYGYVPLEAYLSGRAVVTVRDAGGPLEFVEDGKTGIVVPPSPESLGAAMEACWNRVPELRQMARRGRERVERITWSHVVESLLSGAGL